MDEEVARIAREHGGVLGRREAVQAGLNCRDFRRLRDSGLYVPTGRGSIRARTTPDSWVASVWAGVHALGGEVHLTGAAAAVLLGIARVMAPELVEAMVATTRRPAKIGGWRVIHAMPGDLLGAREIGGLLVTSREVTLRQLARTLPHERTVTVLQDELRRRMTTCQRLRSVTGRGREGSAALRRALLVAGDGAHARGERRMAAAVRRHGIALETQVNLRTDDGASYWLDGLVRAARLGYEIEGPDHLDAAQHDYDCRRANRVLITHGLELMRFSTAYVARDVAGAAGDFVDAVRARAA